MHLNEKVVSLDLLYLKNVGQYVEIWEKRRERLKDNTATTEALF